MENSAKGGWVAELSNGKARIWENYARSIMAQAQSCTKLHYAVFCGG
jgi:hypothetical protein